MLISLFLSMLVLLQGFALTCGINKTYAVSDQDIEPLDQHQIIRIMQDELKLGAIEVDAFLEEAFNSWDIMRRRTRDKGDIEVEFNKYLAICLNRYRTAMEHLPPQKLEKRALKALARLERTALERNAKREKKMLCTVFLNGFETDFNILRGNLRQSRGNQTSDPHCEWLIVFFGGNRDLISAFYKETGTGVDILNGNAALGKKFQASATGPRSTANWKREHDHTHIVAAFDYRGPRAVSGTEFTPKQVWYPLIVPYLEQYKRVWLLDADISLKHFDFEDLSWTFECTDWGLGNQVHDQIDNNLPRGPIIAQPLVYEDTQYYPELNYGSYHRERRRLPNGRYGRQGSLRRHRDLIAYRTRLVEQQAPIFQSDFFEWYAMHLVKPWLPTMLIMESTWGFDTTWCGAAEQYIAFKKSNAIVSEGIEGKEGTSSLSKRRLLGNRMRMQSAHTLRMREEGNSVAVAAEEGGSTSYDYCYGCAVLIRTTPIRHLKSSKKSGMKANKYGGPLAVAVFYMTGHLSKAWVHGMHSTWSKYLKRGNGLGRPTQITGIPASALRGSEAHCAPRGNRNDNNNGSAVISGTRGVVGTTTPLSSGLQ